MTYSERKVAEMCTYPRCNEPPLPDNNECALHRAMSVDRKRYWYHFRRFYRRPKQLCLAFDVPSP